MVCRESRVEDAGHLGLAAGVKLDWCPCASQREQQLLSPLYPNPSLSCKLQSRGCDHGSSTTLITAHMEMCMILLCFWLALSPRVFLHRQKYKHKKEDTFAKQR